MTIPVTAKHLSMTLKELLDLYPLALDWFNKSGRLTIDYITTEQ